MAIRYACFAAANRIHHHTLRRLGAHQPILTLPKRTGLVIISTRRESDKARVYAAQ